MYRYREIVYDLGNKILSGKFENGSFLPPVRRLAAEYGVNPNTMHRVITELERLELLIPQRGRGIMITEDTAAICRLKYRRAEKSLSAFVNQMKELGYSYKEIKDMAAGSFSSAE